MGATPLSFLDTQIASKQWYAYVVTAINAVDESTASNIVYLKSP